MHKCIFCHKDVSISKSVEHIIPESLGNKSHVLPKGYVCDECNNYFARKVEKELLTMPYFISMRSRNNILSKKGKYVKNKFLFPSILQETDGIIEFSEDAIDIFLESPEVFDAINNKKCNTMLSLYLPEPEYPSRIVSRFLAKCAYEFFLYQMPREMYDECVDEFMQDTSPNKSLENIRKYARYGEGEFWEYSQRRIFSEGTLWVNEDSFVPFERLHQMKLFVRETSHEGDDKIYAEVYYILEINGVEYSICLSDTDISEYDKWVEEHPGQSPLDDNKEKQLPFGIYDVNPLLIRKDTI